MMEELQVAQQLDINMGEFWCGQTVLWANYKYNRTVKQVASIAHTLGGKVVGAELLLLNRMRINGCSIHML